MSDISSATSIAPPVDARAPRLAPARPGKRLFDLAAAGLLLLVTAPLCALLALLIRADGGPILFRHTRIGRGGVPFACLKFRSMVVGAEVRLAALLAADPVARAEWRLRCKLRVDPRVTRTGRFLRATSLDELPQLLNVLRGEMSLVGPRPVTAAEYTTHYDRPSALAYAAVRPGITGLWQVSGRSDTSYAERTALDRRYVAEWSGWLDLRILARTIPAVLRRRGAR